MNSLPAKAHIRRRAFSLVLDCLTGISALAVLLLVWRNGFHRDAHASPPDVAAIEKRLIGSRPGQIRASSSNGRDTITFPGLTSEPRLVVLFRSNCPACQATKPSWQQILDATGARLEALTGEPVGAAAEFFDSPHVSIWHGRSTNDLDAVFHSPMVPTTLAVSAAGVIVYAKIGVLGTNDVDSLIRYMTTH